MRFGRSLTIAAGVTVACCLLLAGGAAADHASTDRMVGDGSEDSPVVITDVHELQAIDKGLSGHYVLGSDIDASETATWEGGAGFDPIGDYDEREAFEGSLDGNGYTISDLKIDRPSEEGVGLFGYSNGTISDLTLEDVDVSGGRSVGAVVGYNAGGEWFATDGRVEGVTVTGEVQGTDRGVGGVVGRNEGSVSEASLTGAVEGTDRIVGGLIGTNLGPVSEAYAAGSVDGSVVVGGVAGVNEGPIRASFFAGDVEADRTAGGLAGTNEDAFNDAYAHAHVTAEGSAGGLFGSHSGTVTQAYATGEVTSTYDAGGLIADNEGILTDAYWVVETTGQRHPFAPDEDEAAFDDDAEIDVTGLDIDELTGSDAVSNTDLDFDSPWTTGAEYPRFEWEGGRDVSDAAYDVVLEPVEIDEESAETDGESDGADPDGDVAGVGDRLPGFGVAGALVALLVTGALVGRRKR